MQITGGGVPILRAILNAFRRGSHAPAKERVLPDIFGLNDLENEISRRLRNDRYLLRADGWDESQIEALTEAKISIYMNTRSSPHNDYEVKTDDIGDGYYSD